MKQVNTRYSILLDSSADCMVLSTTVATCFGGDFIGVLEVFCVFSFFTAGEEVSESLEGTFDLDIPPAFLFSPILVVDGDGFVSGIVSFSSLM